MVEKDFKKLQIQYINNKHTVKHLSQNQILGTIKTASFPNQSWFQASPALKEATLMRNQFNLNFSRRQLKTKTLDKA